MARRKAAPKRTILPDPLFHSETMAKFMNVVMQRGKKSVAEKVVYGALDQVVKKLYGKPKSSQEKGREEEGGESGSGSSQRTLKSNQLDIRTSDEARKVAIECFDKAIENVMPMVEVKSRRVGGSNYQVPVEVRADRRMALAMRWLVEYASQRGEKGMMLRLANEIMDAIEGRGGAVKKREDVHRMARANQAFAHYRW